MQVCILFLHLFTILLFSQLIHETKDSGIVKDLGPEFRAGVIGVLTALLLLIITIWVV